MARHCYAVTMPSDVEGFVTAVQSTRPSGDPVRIIAIPQGDELAVRRGTAESKTFECVLARIFYDPPSGALLLPDQREISFEENNGRIWITEWTDE